MSADVLKEKIMLFKKMGQVLSLTAVFCFVACENDSSKGGAASAQIDAKSSFAKNAAVHAAAKHSSQTSNFDNLIGMNLSECNTNGAKAKQKFFGKDAEFLCKNGTWYLQTDIRSIIRSLSKDTLNNILADLKITEEELYAIVDALHSNESASPNIEKMASNFRVKCDAKKDANEWKYEMHMDMAGRPTVTTVSYKFNNNEMIRTETTQVNFGTADLCQKALSNYEQNNEEGIVANTRCDDKGFLTTTISTESEKIDESTKNEILQEVTGICDENQATALLQTN